MTSWFPLLRQEISPSDHGEFDLLRFPFQVDIGIECLRLRCEAHPHAPASSVSRSSSSGILLNSLDPSQRDLYELYLQEQEAYLQTRNWSVHLFDPEHQFRGRWDPGFRDWKMLSPRSASDGLVGGFLPAGSWELVVWIFGPSEERPVINLTVEGSDQPDASPIAIPYDLSCPWVGGEEKLWVVGELHEHTSRSVGARAPLETLAAYHDQGYRFVAVTDHDLQPLSALPQAPPIAVLRGQEMESPFGHALFLGTNAFIRWYEDSGVLPLAEIIHAVHRQGGLFSVLHPFSHSSDRALPSWHWDQTPWLLVDLLEVWPGLWKERFPEIQRNLSLWDSLLNQGIRLFGACGKGGKGVLNGDWCERLPKTLLHADSLSETHLLSALKQGHFYSTREAAIQLYAESEYGGAVMGDELHLPPGRPYLLRADITGAGRSAFVRIIRDGDVYCEMPLSSTQDTTNLKFIERAHPRVSWFRLEIYRYGRPLDDLLALSNPLFVRGVGQ